MLGRTDDMLENPTMRSGVHAFEHYIESIAANEIEHSEDFYEIDSNKPKSRSG